MSSKFIQSALTSVCALMRWEGKKAQWTHPASQFQTDLFALGPGDTTTKTMLCKESKERIRFHVQRDDKQAPHIQSTRVKQERIHGWQKYCIISGKTLSEKSKCSLIRPGKIGPTTENCNASFHFSMKNTANYIHLKANNG